MAKKKTSKKKAPPKKKSAPKKGARKSARKSTAKSKTTAKAAEDIGDDYWPDRRAMGADPDINVTPRNLIERAKKYGWNLPPRQPIPKWPVYRSLWQEAVKAADLGGSSRAAREAEVDLALKERRLAKIDSRLIAEAEDRAKEGVAKAAAELRDALLSRGPRALVGLVKEAKSREEAEDAVADWIGETIVKAVEAHAIRVEQAKRADG